jgi:hypothetical protein
MRHSRSDRVENSVCVPSDHQSLVGRNNPSAHPARRRAEARAAGRVSRGIQFHSEPGGSSADSLSDCGCVLSDAGDEYDGIKSTKRGGQRAQFSADAVNKPIYCEFSARVVRGQERAHIARHARHTEQAGLLVEQFFDGAGVQLEFVHEIQHHAGIQAAATSPHRQPRPGQ